MPFRSQANAFSLLYHTFWCKFKRQHISLKFIYNDTLIWLPPAGFVRRWLLWCFESRAQAAVARAAIFHCCEVFKMRERHHAQMKITSWTVNRVILWLLCDPVFEARKHWVFVTHFIHLFNTTMPMPCTDLRPGAPMSHFLHTRVGMGCQALNFRSRVDYVVKMSRMHAWLKNVQPLYNTFKASALWKTSQVGVSSAVRQERPSMFSILQK